jgi:hypothetical protein
VKTCLPCSRGFHEECKKCKGSEDCHIDNSESLVYNEPEEPKARKKGSTYETLKDPKSTGRKRAAKLYPLASGESCEWRNLRNCGGGRVPIIGCLSGIQEARHHGPVKNTTRNHLGNVHRICTRCHNHWHELNDLIYDEAEYALLPHDPIPATEMEIAEEEMKWLSGKKAQEYTLASSANKGKLKLVD